MAFFFPDHNKSAIKIEVERSDNVVKLSLKDVQVHNLIWSPDSRRIFFEQNDWICTMTADGDDFSELAIGNNPVISIDGNDIFFTAFDTFDGDVGEAGQFETHVMAMNTDDSNVRILGHIIVTSTGLIYDLTLSPTGEQVALQTREEMLVPDTNDDTTYNVSRLSVWSRETGELETVDSFRLHHEMQWSPDGSKLAIAGEMADESERRDIWVLDIADGTMNNITSDSHADYYTSDPNWSPDGSTISYTLWYWLESETNSTVETRVAKADGSEKQQLSTESLGNSYSLGVYDWSPDGSAIAFVSPSDKSRHIWLMDGQGDNQEFVYSVPRTAHELQWSPDGTRIAAMLHRHGSTEIHLIEIQ